LEKKCKRIGRYWTQSKKEGPKYEVGTTLKTRRESIKLDNKLHGPFQVEKVITQTAI
jgi:hypothetical protein